jgi:mxaJ protein
VTALAAVAWPCGALAQSAPAPAASAPAAAAPLRVCLDPANLPYSHADGAGFELRIAELIADTLGQPLQVHWQPLKRGFVRKTLGEGVCDVLMGVPAGFERVLTTRPYYRSTYVFVARGDDPAPLARFDDPRLPQLRIGIQLPGDDGAATPPGHALVQAGAVERVVGFPLDGGEPSASRMVRAVVAGDIDAALVWGPQAGWFVQRAAAPLTLTPTAAPAGLALPFEFAIALGVRKGERALRDRLQAALDERRAQVDAVLQAHGVPRTDGAAAR